jgi:hypothetical protein
VHCNTGLHYVILSPRRHTLLCILQMACLQVLYPCSLQALVYTPVTRPHKGLGLQARIMADTQAAHAHFLNKNAWELP